MKKVKNREFRFAILKTVIIIAMLVTTMGLHTGSVMAVKYGFADVYYDYVALLSSELGFASGTVIRGDADAKGKVGRCVLTVRHAVAEKDEKTGQIKDVKGSGDNLEVENLLFIWLNYTVNIFNKDFPADGASGQVDKWRIHPKYDIAIGKLDARGKFDENRNDFVLNFPKLDSKYFGLHYTRLGDKFITQPNSLNLARIIGYGPTECIKPKPSLPGLLEPLPEDYDPYCNPDLLAVFDKPNLKVRNAGFMKWRQISSNGIGYILEPVDDSCNMPPYTAVKGDSGGPLIYGHDQKLEGIIVGGPKDPKTGLVGVIAVGSYTIRKWLDKQLADLGCGATTATTSQTVS